MATIKICDILTVFQKTDHCATSYEIYDGNTDNILDSSYEDEENLLIWKSELSKGDGTHYRDLENMRARFKLHYRDGSSTIWYELASYDQTAEKPIILTCDEGEILNG